MHTSPNKVEGRPQVPEAVTPEAAAETNQDAALTKRDSEASSVKDTPEHSSCGWKEFVRFLRKLVPSRPEAENARPLSFDEAREMLRVVQCHYEKFPKVVGCAWIM